MNKPTCIFKECERVSETRDWCHRHYEYLRSRGELPPKACLGCGKPCEGLRHYCDEGCKPRCAVLDCPEAARNHSWCTFHYTRWKITGDAATPVSRERYSLGQLCSFGGCENKARKNRLCSTHYGQQCRTGDLVPIKKKVKRPNDLSSCCIYVCGKPIVAYLLCATHAARLKNTGTTRLIVRIERCRFPQCGRPRFGDGWCNKHYKRIQVNGSPFDKHQSWVRDLYLECIICGSSIPAERGSSRYCGQACIWIASDLTRPRSRPCAQCGSVIDLWARNHRGWLKQKNTFVCTSCRRPKNLTRFIPQIVHRDGSKCSLCAMDVDIYLAYPHPMSRSVDHIIPRSRGGEDILENYALSHLVCNVRKGNRLPENV